VQVILPFLKWSFEANNGGGGGGEAATMLDILSRLVQEQPTAMALIRQLIIPSTSVPDPSFICTDPDPSISKPKN
jgi:hypothetical protein